jgi:hypothetical protein
MNSIFYEAVNVNEFIKYNGDKALSNKNRYQHSAPKFFKYK